MKTSTLILATLVSITGCVASAADATDATDADPAAPSAPAPSAPATDRSAAAALPATCADVAAAATGLLDDGDYLLFVGHDAAKPWVAYCFGMTSRANRNIVEYLDLHRTADANFAQFTAGGASFGSDVRTVYSKVRIDPTTLQVDVTDQTFTTSTGSAVLNDTTITSERFGTAASCDGSPSGVGNIDLQGTPFAMSPDSFVRNGFVPAGAPTFSVNNQVVDLTGGGFCGNLAAANDRLQLVYP